MKRCLLLSLLLFAAAAAFGQGTVLFYNHVPAVGLDAPVFDTDATTLLWGYPYTATLAAGPTPDSLQLVPGSATFGGEPGYWMSAGDSLERTIPTVPAGELAFLQVRISSPDGKHGESSIFSVTTGGDTENGTQPPTLPAYLVGLQSITLTPEPPTVALFVAAGFVGFCACARAHCPGHRAGKRN